MVTNPVGQSVDKNNDMRPAASDVPRLLGVLIVEDDHVIRRAVEEGFKHHGFEVWAAADGAEGLELYQRHRLQIDVVLSDVQMPILSGPRMLAVLRQIDPQVRLCFMTGDLRATRCTDLLCSGALRVFAKPFPSIAAMAEEVWEIARSPAESQTTTDGARQDGRPQPEVVVELVIEPINEADLWRSLLAPVSRFVSWLGAVATKCTRRRSGDDSPRVSN